jgi:hypothetical protein
MSEQDVKARDHYQPDVYIGGRRRPSSVTSVALMSDHEMVFCHFSTAQMYTATFDLQKNEQVITQRIHTTYHGQLTQTDLMTSRPDGLICVSNFFQHSFSLYQFDSGRVHHVRDYSPVVNDKVHGVKFFDEDTVVLTSRRQFGGLAFVSLSSGELKRFVPMPDISVQDVCVLGEDDFITVSTFGSPQSEPFQVYDSIIHRVRLVNGKAQVEGTVRISKSHLDSVVLDNNRLFITDQHNDAVLVVCPDTFKLLDRIEGYDFPHGIDVNHGFLAVTNYGSSSVSIKKLRP